MTNQSRRDAAVSRLIERVGDLCRFIDGGGDVAVNQIVTAPDGYEALRRNEADELRAVRWAYRDLNEIPLEVPTEPKANLTAPLTSRWAAQSMRRNTMAWQVLALLYRTRPHDGGLTVEEIEQRLDGKHQTVSARVNELRNSGWLVADGLRKNTSGRYAEIYCLSTQGWYTLQAGVAEARSDGEEADEARARYDHHQMMKEINDER